MTDYDDGEINDYKIFGTGITLFYFRKLAFL
jgi:hypothetical protein